MGLQHRSSKMKEISTYKQKREAHSSLASRFQGVLEIAHCSRNEQLRTSRRYEYIHTLYTYYAYGANTP